MSLFESPSTNAKRVGSKEPKLRESKHERSTTNGAEVEFGGGDLRKRGSGMKNDRRVFRSGEKARG